ncbi:DUF2975 domain-containing protein [Emticicia sp. CRIBPO]|uniref:DUF2975 domain-containing protein n=1 Tax=Emticicia sp. CRIBPO TaxID=2683258 RepID=UPI0014126669|nr:DUF2975 domain-containing protein [Emticicia sp. CRIBPO]NBA88055.1 DUF2975 domain-containing protein [Emticicia sp. CRIBPO]
MKTKTETILIYLKVVVLVTYIGAIIQGAAVMIPLIIGLFTDNIGVAYFQPGEKMSTLKEVSFTLYFFVTTLIIAKIIIGINIWERVRCILDDVKMDNPFRTSVASGIEQLSYSILSFAIINIAGDFYIEHLNKRHEVLNLDRFESGFNLLMGAAILYIIGQIFKRGIEIQQENDLTV